MMISRLKDLVHFLTRMIRSVQINSFSRSTTQFELGHYKLTSTGEPGVEENAENNNGEEGAEGAGAAAPLSPQRLEYQKKMSQNLNGGCDLADAKILSYANKPPTAPEGYQNQLRVLYSQSKVSDITG